MCNNHNRVFGKAAIYELISIELGHVKACLGRVSYLEQQEQSFKRYIEEKGTDYEYLKEHWLRTDFLPEQYIRDEGLVDCMHQAISREGQLLAEEDMAALLDKEMEANVRKAYNKLYGVEGNLRFWEGLLDKASARLTRLQAELKLQDTVQDFLDKHSNNSKALVLAKGRLQDRMAANEIEYETFSLFVNQINEMLEKIDHVRRYRISESKVQLVPDRLRYFEGKVNRLTLQVQLAHLKMFEEKETNTELTVEDIAAEGFKLAQNENEFEQIVAFVRQNS